MRYNLDDFAVQPKTRRMASKQPVIVTQLDTLAPAERARFQRLIEQGRRRIAERSQQV